jgi:hypothetical protein
MNELIRELYERAHAIREYPADDPSRGGNPPTLYWNGELSAKRFAELIVRECILTIQLGVSRDGRSTEKYIRSMKHIKDIQDRFGIRSEDISLWT